MINFINNSYTLSVSVQLEVTFEVYPGFVAERYAALWILFQFDKLF